MNRTVTRKMRQAHREQAARIKKLSSYGKVRREFEVEYRIAAELAKARKRAHMTQQDLAKAMNTTQSVISRIERGANVSVETLERYAGACGRHLQVRIV